MSKKLRIQVKENYVRDVFINIEIENEKMDELDNLMDEFEMGMESYEVLIIDLENKGIKITGCDDGLSLFDFQESNFIEYTEIKEVDEREG